MYTEVTTAVHKCVYGCVHGCVHVPGGEPEPERADVYDEYAKRVHAPVHWHREPIDNLRVRKRKRTPMRRVHYTETAVDKHNDYIRGSLLIDAIRAGNVPFSVCKSVHEPVCKPVRDCTNNSVHKNDSDTMSGLLAHLKTLAVSDL